MIKPLNKKIVLTPADTSRTTSSGIFLPNDNDQRVSIYVVVDCPEGAQVEKGQKVICSEYSGFDMEEEGKKYKLVDEDSLLGIYED